MEVLTLDTLGRILIPQKVREQLGLNAETQLNLSIQDGKIVLEPTIAEFTQKPNVYRVGTALVVDTEPIGNLAAVVDELREERIGDIVADYESTV
jgi:AbrB family looped-hinge helix DNA binding protein